MIFVETSLPGAFLVEPEPLADNRGYFARTWCQREFAARGLTAKVAQCNISFSAKKGTLRGMHFQAPPYQEAKLIRCVAGSIYDVIIDLRRASPDFGRHTAVILRARESRSLFVPEGFAHGFQTLENETEVLYQMSEYYVRESARGVRWDDPAFGIEWPADTRIISEKDRGYPDFTAENYPDLFGRVPVRR